MRAVRLVQEHASEYPSQWAAIRSIAERPPIEVMVACVDAQRETRGVESICRRLPIAPSTYWRVKARQTDPTRRSARAA